MGCCSSKHAVSARFRVNQLQANGKTFEALGISKKEAARLFAVFAAIDEDGSGEISLAEFFEYLDLDRTPFTKRAFSMFDTDGSGEIDFREFVLSVWSYCTYEKASLCRFAFDLYDLDGSGEIDLDEAETLVKSVYGRGFETNIYARRLLTKMSTITSAQSALVAVTRNEFVAFVGKYPALIFPAFHLQGTMRSKVVGDRFWKGATQKRAALFGGDSYVEFVEYMTQDRFKAMVEEEDVSFASEAPYTSPTPGNSHGNPIVRAKLPDTRGGARPVVYSASRLPGNASPTARRKRSKTPEVHFVDEPGVPSSRVRKAIKKMQRDGQMDRQNPLKSHSRTVSKKPVVKRRASSRRLH